MDRGGRNEKRASSRQREGGQGSGPTSSTSAMRHPAESLPQFPYL